MDDENFAAVDDDDTAASFFSFASFDAEQLSSLR